MTVFIGSMYSLVCMTAFERYIASLLKSIQWHEEDLKFWLNFDLKESLNGLMKVHIIQNSLLLNYRLFWKVTSSYLSLLSMNQQIKLLVSYQHEYTQLYHCKPRFWVHKNRCESHCESHVCHTSVTDDDTTVLVINMAYEPTW